LPCAHCGSPAEEVSDVRYGWYVVACTNEDCGITMSEVGIESQAEANAIWNRRGLREKEWVWLSEEEINKYFLDNWARYYSYHGCFREVMRWQEERLKEKNT